jgi:hypothetical protein
VLVCRSGNGAGDGLPERGDDLEAARRLIDKHADAYEAHRLDVVAGKDALLRAMTIRNDSLARHVDVLTAQRDRLRRESAPPLAPLVPAGVPPVAIDPVVRAGPDAPDVPASLEAALAAARHELECLRRSASWRVTAPLRAMHAWLSRRSGPS